MNEVVGNAIDVPRNTYRIDETENQHHPKRHARKKMEHTEEVRAVEKGGEDGNRVPPCVSKDLGVRRRAFHNYEFA